MLDTRGWKLLFGDTQAFFLLSDMRGCCGKGISLEVLWTIIVFLNHKTP